MIKQNGSNIKDIVYNGSYISKVMQNGNVVYERKKPNGVYIQDINNKLYTRAEWQALSSKPTPNGIALISDSYSFVLSLKDIDAKAEYSPTHLINGITTTTDSSVALQDYNGYNNTELIISAASYSAASKAKYFTFPNSQKGYLGSAGEWKLLSNYKSDVDNYLLLLNATPLSVDVAVDIKYYWTSTQCDSNRAWRYYWYSKVTDIQTKSNKYYIRPFTTLDL